MKESTQPATTTTTKKKKTTTQSIPESSISLKMMVLPKITGMPLGTVPTYAHPGDVGLDFVAANLYYDLESDSYIYGTGLACESKASRMSMFIHPRSSIYKTNFYLTNSVGIVDCKTYRGEIKAIFKHRDSLESRIHQMAMDRYDKLSWFKKIFKPGIFGEIKRQIRAEFLSNPGQWAPFKVGERIGQFWLHQVKPINIKVVDKLSDTVRGTGGFGSTGK